MPKDKILIVDDDESMREMLEVILKEDYEVIKAASGEEALTKFANSHPLVVLLDIKLPGISGIEALERILKKDPDIKCLMISMIHDVNTVVECIKKGAHDYMTKEFEYESVLMRVRNAGALAKLKKAYDQQVHKISRLEERLGRIDQEKIQEFPLQEKDFNGELTVCHDLPDDSSLKIVFQRLGPTNTDNLISLCVKGKDLTEQKKKVLGFMLRGLANKEIAKELSIELTTVKAHLKNAFQKLGVTTRPQAIVYLLLKGFSKSIPSTT